MRIDRDGKKRYKVNLHMHTSRSDGHATPAEAAQRYLSEGYDAVAFADHWVFGGENTINGLTILPGAEYNTYHGDSRKGVYHIVPSKRGNQALRSIRKLSGCFACLRRSA